MSVGASQLHMLRAVKSGNTLWESMLNSPILSCTGNKLVSIILLQWANHKSLLASVDHNHEI